MTPFIRCCKHVETVDERTDEWLPGFQNWRVAGLCSGETVVHLCYCGHKRLGVIHRPRANVSVLALPSSCRDAKLGGKWGREQMDPSILFLQLAVNLQLLQTKC